MGSKRPYNLQRNRPESGGADRDEEREKSGLLERDKQLVKKQKSISKRPAKSGPAPENQADGAEEER
jgi:hypothetical protein